MLLIKDKVVLIGLLATILNSSLRFLLHNFHPEIYLKYLLFLYLFLN